MIQLNFMNCKNQADRQTDRQTNRQIDPNWYYDRNEKSKTFACNLNWFFNVNRLDFESAGDYNLKFNFQQQTGGHRK